MSLCFFGLSKVYLLQMDQQYHSAPATLSWAPQSTPYERALRGNIINICFGKFTAKDVEDNGIDVPELYRRAQTRIKKSKNPKILLVDRHKFRCATLATMLERFGCSVKVAFSGRMAYLWYLKRHWQEFDLVICDWDLPDVGGRDLVYYNREAGGDLVFLAILPPNMNSVDVLRSGADLFLRAPAWIHMHTLRELLLPNVESSYGYPAEVMLKQPNHNDLRAVLDQVVYAADTDLESLMKDVKDDTDIVEELDFKSGSEMLSKLLDYVKRHSKASGPGGADPEYVKQLGKALQSSLDCINRLKDDNVVLVSQLRELQSKARKTAFEEMPSDVDPDNINRKEFAAYFNMFRRNLRSLEAENDSLIRELERLAYFKVQVEEGIGGNLAVHFNEVNLTVDPEMLRRKMQGKPELPNDMAASASLSFSTRGNLTAVQPKKGESRFKTFATDRLKSIRDLRQKRLKTKPIAPTLSYESVSRRLECMLMEREDMGVKTRPTAAGTVAPVPQNVWKPMPSEGRVEALHNDVATMMTNFAGECNRLFAQVVGSHPVLATKLEAFSRIVATMIKASNLTPRANDLKQWLDERVGNATVEAKAETGTIREAWDTERHQRTLENKVKIAHLKQAAIKMSHAANDSRLRKTYFAKWQLWLTQWQAEGEVARLAVNNRGNVSEASRDSRTTSDLRREIHRQLKEIEETKHIASSAIRAKAIAEEKAQKLEQYNEKLRIMLDDKSQEFESVAQALDKRKQKAAAMRQRSQSHSTAVSSPLSPSLRSKSMSSIDVAADTVPQSPSQGLRESSSIVDEEPSPTARKTSRSGSLKKKTSSLSNSAGVKKPLSKPSSRRSTTTSEHFGLTGSMEPVPSTSDIEFTESIRPQESADPLVSSRRESRERKSILQSKRVSIAAGHTTAAVASPPHIPSASARVLLTEDQRIHDDEELPSAEVSPKPTAKKTRSRSKSTKKTLKHPTTKTTSAST